MGYQVSTCRVSASDFGDPQNRYRLIVFGAKKGYKLPVLKHTHGEGKKPVVTDGHALKTLEEIAPVAGGLVGLPGGRHVFDHYIEGTELTDKYDNQYKLDANLPANTVRKHNQMRNYMHDRYITVRERARLQGFPDSFRFAGKKSEMFDQI